MPHCDSIFPDIGLVKIHIHKEVRHKYAEVNKTNAANNFKLLSGMSADIAQNWQGFNGQNRTSVCSSSWHDPSEQSDDQVGERDHSLLPSNHGADIAQNWQGFNGQKQTSARSSSWHNPSEQSDDQVGEQDLSLLRSNCGDCHGDQNHGHGGIDKLKVINIWIYKNYCLKIIN